jgi:hypothetical protein
MEVMNDRQDYNFRLGRCWTRDRYTTRGRGPRGDHRASAHAAGPAERSNVRACDVLDRDAVGKAVHGARRFVVAIGFSHSGVAWREAWPKTIANFVAV